MILFAFVLLRGARGPVRRKKWNASFTVVNVTNKVALYNFLSTFSGTHFVTPRSYTAQLTFTF